MKQGCCLSPTLFKIYLHKAQEVWRMKGTKMGIAIGNQFLITLFFADDQVLVANYEEDLDYMMSERRIRNVRFEHEHEEDGVF